MNNYTIIEICDLYNKFCDDESRKLFEVRFEYLLTRNYKRFLREINTLNNEYVCLERNQFVGSFE